MIAPFDINNNNNSRIFNEIEFEKNDNGFISATIESFHYFIEEIPNNNIEKNTDNETKHFFHVHIQGGIGIWNNDNTKEGNGANKKNNGIIIPFHNFILWLKSESKETILVNIKKLNDSTDNIKENNTNNNIIFIIFIIVKLQNKKYKKNKDNKNKTSYIIKNICTFLVVVTNLNFIHMPHMKDQKRKQSCL